MRPFRESGGGEGGDGVVGCFYCLAGGVGGWEDRVVVVGLEHPDLGFELGGRNG